MNAAADRAAKMNKSIEFLAAEVTRFRGAAQMYLDRGLGEAAKGYDQMADEMQERHQFSLTEGAAA